MIGGKQRYWRLAVGLLFGVVGIAAESCGPAPATVSTTTPGIRAWPATEDGLAPEGPPAYETDESSLDLPAGCWVVHIEAFYGNSRVFHNDSSRPLTENQRWQQEAVCLEPAEAVTLRPTLPISREFSGTHIVLLVDSEGEAVTGEVVVKAERVSASTALEEIEIVVDNGRLSLSGSRFPPSYCYKVLEVEHPVYEFPSLVGVESCQPLSTLTFAFGVEPGASYEPAQVVVDLKNWADRGDSRFDFDVQFTDLESDIAYPLDYSADPGLNSYEVPAGCYDIRLFIRGEGAMMAEVTRGVRRLRDVCVGAGEVRTVSSGDVVGAGFEGLAPFIPVVATDGAGNPVPGLQVDFFYPLGELTIEEVRNIDHSATDARGVFYDSTTTGENGRSLFPHYAECLVSTAIAPPGYRFSTGAYSQSTVCEGDPLTLELQPVAD